MGDKQSFPIFLSVWNQVQGQTTPAVHFRIAHWLEGAWHSDNAALKRLLLMAFRGCGKSTLVGLFAAWLLYRKADLRILVLAAETHLATRMVRNIKRILERHPLTAHLKPSVPDQWASDRFTVNRDMELRDSSVAARGIMANITGSRADVIICDDVEVRNTADTPEKRRELRERLGDLEYILTPGGMSLYVGTPHAYETIYDTKKEGFLEDFAALRIPVLQHNASAWPERFSLPVIESLRKTQGPNTFSSQMMLQPVSLEDCRLNPELLQFYEDELHYAERGGESVLSLQDTRMVSASAWWDPAFGSAKGDNSVLAIVYADADGRQYLHHLEYLTLNAADETDEARQQCLQIAKLIERFYLPSLAIETNGIGKFLPGMLRTVLDEEKVGCSILEQHSTRPKHIRILEAFDARLAAQTVYVHQRIKTTPFLEEMRAWRPGATKVHDDGLDAVAGALALKPARFKRNYAGIKGQSWHGGGAQHKANTDFTI